ncbi:MAG: hypothetical protein JXL84_18300 [Deltaproteobacteria bacterium]|nr:hypothetical protein [Deltaproteobacteria bacterium]
MIVLGINPGFDGTAALLIDGEIKAAVAEERLSRIKGHQGFPHRAIQECLRISGVEGSWIDCVAFASQSFLGFSRAFTDLMLSPAGMDFSNPLPFEVRLLMLKKDLETEILGPVRFRCLSRRYSRSAYEGVLREKGITAPIIGVDHHLAHAASAYFFNPADPCLVITADGTGDGLGATAYVGSRGRLRRLASTPSAHAPGSIYSAVTGYLGFKRHRHEGKVLGLAATGDPETAMERLSPCLDLSADSSAFRIPLVEREKVEDLALKQWLVEKGYYLGPTNFILQRHLERNLMGVSREDVAAAGQRLFEQVFLNHISTLREKTRLQSIALAGGVFANVVLNQKILELPGVENLSVHPNMGDGGLAVGAAAVVTARALRDQGKRLLPRPLRDVYLGPAYPSRDIERLLEREDARVEETPNLASSVAELLARHRVVGLFQGRMEYGPRALGNRTILANPSDPRIKDLLNHRLRRTEFMPFAPIVRRSDMGRYFHMPKGGEYPMHFMTLTCNVTGEAREKAPGVVHVDGTARPQIVGNGLLSGILREFEKRTGFALLINTSFNIHEEPIVCTPQDAWRCFRDGSLDALVLDRRLVLSGNGRLTERTRPRRSRRIPSSPPGEVVVSLQGSVSP